MNTFLVIPPKPRKPVKPTKSAKPIKPVISRFTNIPLQVYYLVLKPCFIIITIISDLPKGRYFGRTVLAFWPLSIEKFFLGEISTFDQNKYFWAKSYLLAKTPTALCVKRGQVSYTRQFCISLLLGIRNTTYIINLLHTA